MKREKISLTQLVAQMVSEEILTNSELSIESIYPENAGVIAQRASRRGAASADEEKLEILTKFKSDSRL